MKPLEAFLVLAEAVVIGSLDQAQANGGPLRSCKTFEAGVREEGVPEGPHVHQIDFGALYQRGIPLISATRDLTILTVMTIFCTTILKACSVLHYIVGTAVDVR